MRPAFANGKICDVEIPTTDIERSTAFYQAVFGGNIRQCGDCGKAFDEGFGK